MKKFVTVLFFFLFSLPLFAQTDEKTVPLSPVKFYQGEENMPYAFTPYRGEYAYRGKLGFLKATLVKATTEIIELPDEWQETQFYQPSAAMAQMFNDRDQPSGAIKDVELVSKIDRKTGLLKSMRGNILKNGNAGIELFINSDGQIVITEIDGSRKKQKTIDTKEKIYPCAYNNVFFSYLPLSEQFEGSFTCLDLEDLDTGSPTIRFVKRTLKVVGSETVTVEGGTFDCYKLSDKTEEIRYNKDGTVKESKKTVKKDFSGSNFLSNFYSSVWIEKNTRKFIKGEVGTSKGSLSVELQKMRGRNL
ncbi:MAG: hypothetical protein ABJA66_01345 [Actinomycetota bacterium]